jgi:DNA-binding transcriptional LysR family regulator
MFHITLRQMAAFEAVARLGSVMAAARELGLSQSAVSMALKDVEAGLGVDLFQRQRKKLTLNENGRRLQPRARTLLAQAREIETAATGGDLQGDLDIATGVTIGNYEIPALCAAFSRQHPQVRLNVRLMQSAQVVDAVDNLQCDIGFVEGPTIRPRLSVIEWRRDPMVVVAPRTHPLAGRRVAMAALKDEAWVLLPLNTFGRSVFTKPAVDLVGRLSVPIESNGIEAIKRAVAAGGGLGCLSLTAVKEELAHGTLKQIHVRDLDLSQPFNIVMRRDLYQGALAAAFVDFVTSAPGKKKR